MAGRERGGRSSEGSGREQKAWKREERVAKVVESLLVSDSLELLLALPSSDSFEVEKKRQ